jgi:hypothetical protein
LKAKLIAGLLLLAASAALGQETKTPQISFLNIDWNAAASDLPTQLNTVTAERFQNIAASPVPVLLPFDVDAYLRDKAEDRVKNDADGGYQSGFRFSKFFLAGPAGYDAAFTVRPPDIPALSAVHFSADVEVQISGMTLLYDLGDTGIEQKATPVALADFPGLRRVYLESHLRYVFTRYGVVYAVSIECYEGPSRGRRLSCRDADPIAMHFLKALSVVGGTPRPASAAVDARKIERPDGRSTVFAYYPPGQIIPGTGFHGRSGRGDYTVYSQIRFPLAEAPAHTYSQMFMNLHDCNQAGLSPRTIRRGGAAFRCPPSDKLAEAGPTAGRNLTYPWRDNFCETRGFFVGQCPAGIGHQGEDIVPVDCRLSSQDTDHCERKLHPVVAVHDGAVLRSPGQEGLVIVVNTQNEHVRFRYLHMNPKAIDAEGLVSGRTVREGEPVGKVGNYNGREGGTSFHLHVDMQVPTKDGWVLVNPYMTLVSAYERLIGGRGEEIHEEINEAAIANTGSLPHLTNAAPRRSKIQRGHYKHAAGSKYKKYKFSKHCVRRQGC